MRNLLVVVMFLAGISLLVGTTILAQGSRSRERDIQEGKMLFHWKDSPTGIACIHCHADFNEKKEPDAHVRPAHPLFNGGFRAEWQSWDGRKIKTLDLAISTCMQRWITERGEDGGKTPAKHQIRQLKAYLKSDKLSPEKKSKPIEPNFTKKLPRESALGWEIQNWGPRCSASHVSYATLLTGVDRHHPSCAMVTADTKLRRRSGRSTIPA